MTKRARILLAETTVNIMVRNLLCLLDVVCVPKTLSEFDGVMESPKLAE